MKSIKIAYDLIITKGISSHLLLWLATSKVYSSLASSSLMMSVTTSTRPIWALFYSNIFRSLQSLYSEPDFFIVAPSSILSASGLSIMSHTKPPHSLFILIVTLEAFGWQASITQIISLSFTDETLYKCGSSSVAILTPGNSTTNPLASFPRLLHYYYSHQRTTLVGHGHNDWRWHWQHFHQVLQ